MCVWATVSPTAGCSTTADSDQRAASAGRPSATWRKHTWDTLAGPGTRQEPIRNQSGTSPTSHTQLLLLRELLVHSESSEDLAYEDMSEVSPAPSSSFPSSLPHLPPLLLPGLQGQKVVFEFFSDVVFVEQLLAFLCLEERKGRDSFNARRFCLFKVSPARV